MDAYAFISKIDEKSFSVLQQLSRFSVRTAGCFSAYAAFSAESTQDLREIGERIAASAPGQVRMLLSVEEPSVAVRSSSPGWPWNCIDRETGEFDYDCLGSPTPSNVPKAESFAAVELTAASGLREELRGRLTLTGNVIGMARLLDPSRLLVEVSNPDRDAMLRTLETIGEMPEVTTARAGIAVHPIPRPTTSD